MTPVDARGLEPGIRTAVVLVTHDTRDEVLAALSTLPVELERVVVDSGSVDGTATAVRAAAPGVRVIELANVGFARAANAGVRATSAEAIVVANADVRFGPGAVSELVEVLACDEQVAAVGPRVIYPDGRPQASARRRPDVRTAIGHALLGRLLPDNRWTRRYHERDAAVDVPRDVDWLSGCVMAVRREAFEAIGGFDPGYFLYVEDVDLADRLRAAGWRLRYQPGVEVVHLVGASTRRARGRALVWHAQSLQRYSAQRLTGPLRALRPLLWVALAGWVALTWLFERLGPSGRSPTGERHGRPPQGAAPPLQEGLAASDRGVGP
ncbi:MAG: glycosyltransferase [Nitriliruptoraceae bacterium]